MRRAPLAPIQCILCLPCQKIVWLRRAPRDCSRCGASVFLSRPATTDEIAVMNLTARGRRATAPPKPRERWDIWKDGAVWMVQGPDAPVYFNTRKTARQVAKRGHELDAVLKVTAATCAQIDKELRGRA